MSSRRSNTNWRGFLDLVVVVVVTVLLWVALESPVSLGPLRVVVGLSYGLFVPGYAIVSALVPEARQRVSPDDTTGEPAETTQFDAVTRVLLSIALSVALAAPVGAFLGMTAVGFTATALGGVLSVLTLFCVAVAFVRRWRLPTGERFDILSTTAFASVQGSLVEQSRRDRLVNALVICSVALVICSVGYAVVSTQAADPYTEFYVLTEDAQGDYVPQSDVRLGGDSERRVRLSATNHEHGRTNYTMVVRLQRIEIVDNSTSTPTATPTDSIRVLETTVQDRTTFSLDDGETWIQTRSLSPPTSAGDDELYRAQYFLYRGNQSVDHDDDPYRTVWITVRSGNDTSVEPPDRLERQSPPPLVTGEAVRR